MAVALSEADVAGMLEVLHEAADVDGPDAFTEPVVDALMRLLPVDGGACSNVFAGRNPDVPPEQLTICDFASIGAEWLVPCGTEWRDEFSEAVRLYGREEEVVPPTPELMGRAVRESDLMSYRERRATHLWWEVDRHFGPDSLALWLPGPEEGVMRRFNLTMLKRGAIPDRYVRILQLLAPHFVVFYRRAAARREAAAADDSPLTPREREILSLVAAGKANKEIARRLWLSPHTVRSHLENVFEKLEVNSRSAAVARAFGDPAAAPRPKDPTNIGWPRRPGQKTMVVWFDCPRFSPSSSPPLLPSPIPRPASVRDRRRLLGARKSYLRGRRAVRGHARTRHPGRCGRGLPRHPGIGHAAASPCRRCARTGLPSGGDPQLAGPRAPSRRRLCPRLPADLGCHREGEHPGAAR